METVKITVTKQNSPERITVLKILNSGILQSTNVKNLGKSLVVKVNFVVVINKY